MDVEAKILAQLSAFEQTSKKASEKEKAFERARQLQEPDPSTVAPAPYPSLVSKFKHLLAEYDSVLQNGDKMLVDKHSSEMTTLASSLHQIGGLELMRFTLYTYCPQQHHNYVDIAWNGVGLWTA